MIQNIFTTAFVGVAFFLGLQIGRLYLPNTNVSEQVKQEVPSPQEIVILDSKKNLFKSGKLLDSKKNMASLQKSKYREYLSPFFVGNETTKTFLDLLLIQAYENQYLKLESWRRYYTLLEDLNRMGAVVFDDLKEVYYRLPKDFVGEKSFLVQLVIGLDVLYEDKIDFLKKEVFSFKRRGISQNDDLFLTANLLEAFVFIAKKDDLENLKSEFYTEQSHLDRDMIALFEKMLRR